MPAITQQQIEILEALGECIAVASNNSTLIFIELHGNGEMIKVGTADHRPCRHSIWSFQEAYVYLTEELDALLAENYGIEV